MVRDIGVHRANDSDLIDRFGDMREELADLDPALPMATEFERRTEGRAGFSLGAQVFYRQLLAVQFIELGLRVEGVDVGGTSVHEEVDDPLRLRGEGGRARQARQRQGPAAR